MTCVQSLFGGRSGSCLIPNINLMRFGASLLIISERKWTQPQLIDLFFFMCPNVGPCDNVQIIPVDISPADIHVLFVLGFLFLGRWVFLPEFLVIFLLLLPGLRIPLVHFVDDLPETHTDTHTQTLGK